jgi:flagellar P-ring protein precursor FlgI
VPKNFKEEDRVAAFISDVSQVYFDTDSKARVVFNEKTGTIVIGAEVRISTCAVSHGNLYVDVKDVMGVSQPSPFTRAEAPNANGDGIKTQVINDVTTTVEEQKSRVFEIPNTTTVGELVKVLNSLGVTSRDIMVIFHALRAAGALHADLESI